MGQKEITKKMLPVIKAIADGKTIQLHNGKEENLAEYRIKTDDESKLKNKLTETQKHYRPFRDNKEQKHTKNCLKMNSE